MQIRRELRLISVLVIALSFLSGWFVPSFYEWTGSEQSRPSPWVGWTALALLVSACAIWIGIPWLSFANAQDSVAQREGKLVRMQFNIQTMLVLTTLAAVAVVGLIKVPMVVSGGLYGLVLIYTIGLWTLRPRFRWQILALVSCMSLPYVWIVADGDLTNATSLMWLIVGLPGFFPTLAIGSFIGQHARELNWLAILLTATQLGVGVWMIRLGPKRTLAFLVFALLISLYGSFVLNALMRM